MSKKESIIVSVGMAIYGIIIFVLGLFGGKSKGEADVLKKIIDRSDEIDKKKEEILPFDPGKATKEEIADYYNNLSEEDKKKFQEKVNRIAELSVRQNELLSFGEEI